MIEDAKALVSHAQSVGTDRDDPLILELAETVLSLVKEMELRELHHFEVEQDNAKIQAQALRDAAKFREERYLDRDYWNLIAQLYQPGESLHAVWLRYRADQIERGEEP